MGNEQRFQVGFRILLGVFLALGLLAFPSACSMSPASSANRVTTKSAGNGFEVRRFALSLTQINVGQIAQSDTDLVIVEPNGMAPGTVARLKRRPDGGRRIVLAYPNVGEAETYRGYWRSSWNRTPPDWVGKPNRDWPDHYFVEFWRPEWHGILMGSRGSAMDRIVAAGFDGVFLDSVDKYLVWKGRQGQARSEMLKLVKRIGSYGRARNQRFLVVPNNAEDLLSDRGYRRAIDAVVKESLFYGVPRQGQRNSSQLVNWSVRQLRRAQNDGRPILVIEYLNSRRSQADAAARLCELGMLGTFGPRNLNRLTQPVTAGETAINRIGRFPGPS